jgi:hypothetical protein
MYYLVTFKYEPFLVQGKEYDIVVSEDPVEFIVRNKRLSEELGNRFIVYGYKPINETEYEMLKPFNPTREGCFSLKEGDYTNK